MIINYIWVTLWGTISLLPEIVSYLPGSGSYNMSNDLHQPWCTLFLFVVRNRKAEAGSTRTMSFNHCDYPLTFSLPDTRLKFMASQQSSSLISSHSEYCLSPPSGASLTCHPVNKPTTHNPGQEGNSRDLQTTRHPALFHQLGSTQKIATSRHSGTSGSSNPCNNCPWKGDFIAATVVKCK